MHLPGRLVDLEWLLQNLDHSQLIILDADWYRPFIRHWTNSGRIDDFDGITVV